MTSANLWLGLQLQQNECIYLNLNWGCQRFGEMGWQVYCQLMPKCVDEVRTGHRNAKCACIHVQVFGCLSENSSEKTMTYVISDFVSSLFSLLKINFWDIWAQFASPGGPEMTENFEQIWIPWKSEISHDPQTCLMPDIIYFKVVWKVHNFFLCLATLNRWWLHGNYCPTKFQANRKFLTLWGLVHRSGLTLDQAMACCLFSAKLLCDGRLSIQPSRTNLSEIWIKIQDFSFQENVVYKMVAILPWPHCI